MGSVVVVVVAAVVVQRILKYVFVVQKNVSQNEGIVPWKSSFVVAVVASVNFVPPPAAPAAAGLRSHPVIVVSVQDCG